MQHFENRIHRLENQIEQMRQHVELITRAMTIDEIIQPSEPEQEDQNMDRCQRFLDSLPQVANLKRSS
jgi:archaellum component FlaC